MPDPGAEHPLLPLVTGWLSTIKKAKKRKATLFGNDAEEAMKFFSGPANYMFSDDFMKKKRRQGDDDSDDIMPPSFQICINKVAEIVQLFGPSLYNQNPHRQVSPRVPPDLSPMLLGNPADPFVQQQYQMLMQQKEMTKAVASDKAALVEHLLNYTPNELDLEGHSRKVLDESLIKGMGLWFTEVYQPAHLGFRMIGSFYRSVDDIQLDSDATDWDDVLWIAIECIHPIWQVERDYGWEPDSLKGNMESEASQGLTEGTEFDKTDRERGESNDLIRYWKIYSKMGMGNRLKKVTAEMPFDVEQLGDYCFLAVADGHKTPLNLPPTIMDSGDPEALFEAVQWPIPFWIDGGWPIEPIGYHGVPNQVWPMSHVKPGMGELQFLNWAMSYLASRVRISCRDFIGVMKAAGEEIKNTILNGGDFTLIEIEGDLSPNGRVNDLVSFLQHPQVNGDIWTVISAVAEQFDKRVGLTELMYGMAGAVSRSATDINVRASSSAVRPDDMRKQAEKAMTNLARKEAFAWRWAAEAEDVAPILGPEGAYAWEQLVMATDPVMFSRELDCRIESGSMQKPNKNLRIDQMGQAIQTMGPLLQGYMMATGNSGPMNALLSDWGKAMELDVTNYLIPPMQMMPPPQEQPPEEQGPPQGQTA